MVPSLVSNVWQHQTPLLSRLKPLMSYLRYCKVGCFDSYFIHSHTNSSSYAALLTPAFSSKPSKAHLFLLSMAQPRAGRGVSQCVLGLYSPATEPSSVTLNTAYILLAFQNIKFSKNSDSKVTATSSHKQMQSSKHYIPKQARIWHGLQFPTKRAAYHLLVLEQRFTHFSYLLKL